MEPLNELWPISDVPSKCISIYDGPCVFLQEYGEADRLSQIMFAAYWFQGEFLNGGLAQFFANSTGVLAPEAVDACKVLNMPLLAAQLEGAMKLFGLPYPRERTVRQAKLTEFEERSDAGETPLDALDVEIDRLIYEENGGLESSAIAYMENHPA
jgi:hypothetical protein